MALTGRRSTSSRPMPVIGRPTWPRVSARIFAPFVAQGKPVAITEFGCAAHSGAADMASRGISDLIEWDDRGRPLRLKGNPIRDEDEQARYLTELLKVFDSEGVDASFVYTFARYDLVDGGESRADFDMASAGVVRVLDG